MPESRDPIPSTPQPSAATARGLRAGRSEPPATAEVAEPRTRRQRILHRLGLWPRLHNPLSYRSSLLAAFMAFGLLPTIFFGMWLDHAFRDGSTGPLRPSAPSAPSLGAPASPTERAAIEAGRNRVWVLIAGLSLAAAQLAVSAWLSGRWAGPIDALPRRLRSLDAEGTEGESGRSDRLVPRELRQVQDAIVHLRKRIDRTLAEMSTTRFQLDQTASDVSRVRQSVERQVLERTQELVERLKVAEKSERTKGLFLAQLSHEIRTPLNGVLGMLQLLERSPLTDEQRDWVETLRSSAGTLLNVLDDTLDYSKIEAGKMRLVSEEFDLRQVLERVGKLFAPKAAEKKLVLDVQIDPSLPERVKGDADRLAQVVSNLVSNAIKFTQTGRVRLSVHTTSRDVSLVGLRIEVEDTGPGMDADTQARLFQAYVQAEGAAQRRSSGGIGLGLAIARQLVQLMGGQIVVRSRPGAGTLLAVDLILPAIETRPTAAVAPIPQAPKPFRPLRLLVVDDDPTSRKFLQILLGRAGHEVKMLETAEAMLSEWVLGSRFDAVLLDLRLPQMSGLELAAQLRELERGAVNTAVSARSGTAPSGAHTHLIALTASALEEDRRQALQAGFDQFLPKPVRVAELQRALDRVPVMG
jgi:signal transduction histidine kinase/CheY-like chemotaxis protein